MPIQIVKKGNYDKEVLPWTLDDEAAEFLEGFICNKLRTKNDNKKIKLFRTVKESELIAFASAKKMRYCKNPEKTEVRKIINEMDRKYPCTLFNLLKSSEKLKKILANAKKRN